MFKKLLLLLSGLIGLGFITRSAGAAELISKDIPMLKKSFDDVSLGTQDFR